tara:strand:- start:1255 stop:1650 length:396 start_codon:yes stop_codon:yes gene_type:complete
MKTFKSYVVEHFGIYEGTTVPLEQPMIELDEAQGEYQGRDVELESPRRASEGKKYVVYVKNPESGNVVKIRFGDEKGGLTAKINDKAAAKNFASRHNCDTKTDKMTAGYWSCRLPHYAKELGLTGGGKWFW